MLSTVLHSSWGGGGGGHVNLLFLSDLVGDVN